jgi:hypothetical protein
LAVSITPPREWKEGFMSSASCEFYGVADLATNHIQCDTMHTVIGVLIMEVDMVGFAVETYGSLDILVNNSQSWGTRDQPTGQTLGVDGGSFLHT